MSFNCPICSNSANKDFIEARGYTVRRCQNCATDFVAPAPSEQQMKDYYDRADWFEGGEHGGYVSYDGQTDGSPEWLVRLMDDIQERNPSPSVLDIGCAYGTHLALAQERGWSCFGVEPSQHARRTAQERHKRIFITETVEEIPPHKFDLVLMLEVIEHLSDPYPMFYEMFAKGQIAPDTTVAITTPNARSWAALSDSVGWEFRHPPSHLTFYSGQTFTTLLERLRFSNIRVEGQHPLKLEPAPFFSDENLKVNEPLASYAGLKVVATGSDFSSFMQERFVPGTWSELTAYEHLPRYLFASRQASHKRVLDFGCGSGYGAKALSDTATYVLAVDIDDGALKFARSEHSSPNLEFRKVLDLGGGFEQSSFDLITCFEVIEHLNEDDQKRLLKNFRRILAPDGLLIVSTPNPSITGLYGDNPFHLKEMSLTEFRGALAENFAYTIIFNQKLISGSMLTRNDVDAGNVVTTAPMYPEEESNGEADAAWVAVCSQTEFSAMGQSFYFDNKRDFVRHRVDEIAAKNRYEISLYQETKRAAEFEHALTSASAFRDPDALQNVPLKIRHDCDVLHPEHLKLVAEYESVTAEVSSLRQHLSALQNELAMIRHDRDVLHSEHVQLVAEYNSVTTEVSSLQQHLSALQSRAQLIETSLRWRLMNRIARYAPALRPVINRARIIRETLAGRRRHTSAPAGAHAVEIDAQDLAYETACEPKWNEQQKRYHFLVDETYRAMQEAKTGLAKSLVAPYSLRLKTFAPDTLVLPKVLHVIPNVYVGGSTQLIIDIVEHLSGEFRHEVVTSALWPAGPHIGLKVHLVPLTEMGAMQGVLEQMRPDIVHIHYWGLTDDPWYWAALEQIQQYKALPIVENVNTPVEPMLSSQVNQYVFVSEYVRKEFGSRLSDDLASVIYPGIDLSLFSDPFDGEDAINAIGMVYRLEDDKLTIDAIDLFIEVVKRRPRTRVYIIGGGSFLKAWIRKTKEEGVRGNFRFTGYVPYQDLPEWYNRFSLFVAPVYKESFGQVAPFAMAKRQVVAGYKIGALPEIAGSHEFFGSGLVETAKIITDLLDDLPKRERIGLTNQKRAAAMFAVEAMISAYERLYKRLLS
ncbi:methyltransferase domain-containing protein [Rhizobium anhuiense]|uniref:methyltransferase domain-containing protein n=1 Tax=Rhizobium anhuiense TaxID=1184720 RepID=UPI0014423327|nr:methyltransferase domain-containing protein [Rhizobium anhuiense]